MIVPRFSRRPLEGPVEAQVAPWQIVSLVSLVGCGVGKGKKKRRGKRQTVFVSENHE